MMAPQVAQEGESRRSTISLSASEACTGPLLVPGMPVMPRSFSKGLGTGDWGLEERPLLAARSGAMPPWGGVVLPMPGADPGALLKTS